ncbi:hypothetical protein H696_02781 [Fonticula alba]|uniref:Tetraspanin n=1 Tax=Fonticula alba TaxID=691883 RepID=A0A058Z938_FONAL|nr:hypothetical protein H696_02781 [Fonticula alba]KCV70438.1 hypothetical protein H696_02781 [Fonticula alba]|eukprot:XP_009494954.1 hypothetical protein H696_02781 [Fonticula alba]
MAASNLRFLKIVTAVVNLLFFISGVALITVGAYALHDELSALTSVTLSVGMIILGCLVTIISFLGCLGSIRESPGMLKAYATFTFLFIVCEVAIGITAYLMRDDIPEIAQKSWSRLHEEDQDAIEDLQNRFKCCGWSTTDDHSVPTENCPAATGFTESCSASIISFIESNLAYIATAGIVIAVLQILCFGFSCFMISRINRNRQHERMVEESRHLNRRDEGYNTYV